MIDYSKAYEDIKSTPFVDTNKSFDLREPYGWMPALACRQQKQDLLLSHNLRFAYRFGWNKEEILEITDISERVYNELMPDIKVRFPISSVCINGEVIVV